MSKRTEAKSPCLASQVTHSLQRGGNFEREIAPNLESAAGCKGLVVWRGSPAKQRIGQPFPSEDEAVEDAQVEDGDNNVCAPPAGLRQWWQPL